MDRRDLLKTIGLSAGYIIAGSTLTQLLVSCEAKHNMAWKPLFLNDMQAYVVEQITNIILPKSNTPSALEVKTPQFLDLILNDLVSKKEQAIFIKGGRIFNSKFEDLFNKSILKGTQKDFSEIIATYLDLSKKDETKVIKLVKSKDIEVTASESYFLYKYLIFVRHYTLFAYYTSEAVEDEILKFDPYTGKYIACKLGLEEHL